MKNIKLKIIILIVALFVPAFTNASNELAPGTIEFKVGEKNYRYTDNLLVKVKRLDEFTYRLMLGFEDRVRRAELLISAEIPVEDIKNNQHLNLAHNRLSFMFKTVGRSIVLMPNTRMARPMNYDLGKKRFKNLKRKRKAKRIRDWRFIKRSERLKNSLGVIRNEKMDGSELFLNIEPIIKDDEIKEFRGSFSGLVGIKAQGRKGLRAIRIQSGKFRAELEK